VEYGRFLRAHCAVDIWVVVFWRGIFGGLSIAVLTMIERREERQRLARLLSFIKK
jgi:hypothetical protein